MHLPRPPACSAWTVALTIAIRALVEQCEVTTFETENVDVDVLIELADRGHRIVPDPRLRRRLTNKLEQKRMLRDLGFAVPEFIELNQPSMAALREFGLPAVLKRQRGGYDGGGVLVLRPNDEPAALWREPSLVEAFVEDAVELAVLVARTATGGSVAYPVVEMVFSPQRHLLDYLIGEWSRGALAEHFGEEGTASGQRGMERKAEQARAARAVK